MTPVCRTSTPVQLWLIYLHTGRTGVLVYGIHYLEPQKNVFCVATKARAIPRHFLIWMRTVGQIRHADYRGVFVIKYAFHRWTRQRIHTTFIVVDRYLRLMGDHDDVIKWKHFPRYWPFVGGIHRSPVNSPHKGQWRGALMFTLIWARINGWVNNCEAGDLRRNLAHYDVIVMIKRFQTRWSLIWNRFIPISSQVSTYHIKVKWILIISIANVLEKLQSCTKPSIS